MKDIPDIRVIYTGGTIGSEAKDGRVAPAGKASELARRWLAEGGRARITEDRPVEILSENISQDALDRMATAVRRAVSEGADGIVLTHGTDTLDFTANYFGRVFGDLPIPLVLISALYPLSDPRSNGFVNFSGAMTFIRDCGIGGAFVSNANPGKVCRIYLAERLLPADADGVFRGYGGAIGRISDGRYVHDEKAFPIAELKARASRPAVPEGLCRDILVIQARALMDFSVYDLARRPRAVVVGLYHSGTICTEGDEGSFVPFAERCAELGIPVVLSGIRRGANVYASAHKIPSSCLIAYDRSLGMTIVEVMSSLHLGLDLKRVFAE